MPDLITHGALALLLKRATKGGHIASFVAGNLLPDLLARVPGIGLQRLRDQLEIPIPDWAMYLWGPLHLPVGMLPAAYALSFAFPSEQRSGIFRSLLLGMLMHLAVDCLQFHYGVGYSLFYPITKRTFELGWIGSEDSVFIAPVLVLLCIWVWWPRKSPTPGTQNGIPSGSG